MIDKKYINLINNISLNLGIKHPAVEEVNQLNTDTQQAATEPCKNILYIKADQSDDINLTFAICHELRHVWQYQKHYKQYFKKYKSVSECSNNTEYNLQPAEVDAHAFARFVLLTMDIDINLSDTLDHVVIDAINTRVKEIAAEY